VSVASAWACCCGWQRSRSSRIGVTTPPDSEDLADARSYVLLPCPRWLLFSYVVSQTPEDLVSRRKSIYYSTSMADAMLTIKGNGKRYALVGVPCFITAGRLLARNDEQLNWLV
jgi:hypothetical protein